MCSFNARTPMNEVVKIDAEIAKGYATVKLTLLKIKTHNSVQVPYSKQAKIKYGCNISLPKNSNETKFKPSILPADILKKSWPNAKIIPYNTRRAMGNDFNIFNKRGAKRTLL